MVTMYFSACNLDTPTPPMSWSASDTTAFHLIAVHGRDALDVAHECVRAFLRNSDVDGVYTWLTVIDAIKQTLGGGA